MSSATVTPSKQSKSKKTTKAKAGSSAEEMAGRQREISVSEFFAKNRHLLGFDNARKAMLTAVKEAVDNALDACEEANILPDIRVEILQMSETRFKITVRDNGPGIVRKQIENIFGETGAPVEEPVEDMQIEAPVEEPVEDMQIETPVQQTPMQDRALQVATRVMATSDFAGVQTARTTDEAYQAKNEQKHTWGKNSKPRQTPKEKVRPGQSAAPLKSRVQQSRRRRRPGGTC